jgi:hypothetical protein
MSQLVEKRFISKLYMDQSAEVQLGQGETRSLKTGRGVGQGCCLSLMLFNLYNKYLTDKALDAFGGFKIGQVICTVKCADDLVLLANEEMMLQSMIGRLIEIGRCYGMEMNVVKTTVLRILR